MQISSINTINYNSRPTFMSWEREVRNAKKGVINRNNTCFFREKDLFYRLTKLLSESFENVPKVNVYCFGCSDGSEAFSFIMSMLSLKEETTPQKFLPIIARDIDSVAIEKAKNNDERALLALKTWQDDIAIGILGLNNIFDTECFVLSGSMEKFVDTKKIEKFVNKNTVTTPTKIYHAKAGNYSGLIGAALLGFEKI